MGSVFRAEHGWCDNRCERCPIAKRCEVAILERARKGEEDPEVAAPVIAKVTAGARTAAEVFAEIERIALPPTEPATRLNKLSLAYGIAIGRLGQAAREAHPEAARVLEWDGMLVARKGANLSGFLEDVPPEILAEDDSGEDGFDESGGPIVLMLEVISREIEQALHTVLEPEMLASFETVHIELADALAPLTSRVKPETRAEMARLIEIGEAPSPFLVTE